jgi:hypothetical protein
VTAELTAPIGTAAPSGRTGSPAAVRKGCLGRCYSINPTATPEPRRLLLWSRPAVGVSQNRASADISFCCEPWRLASQCRLATSGWIGGLARQQSDSNMLRAATLREGRKV